MVFNIKKYGIILVIAILFVVLSFSIVEVIIESPDYEDYCGMGDPFGRPAPDVNECSKITGPSSEEIDNYNDVKGVIEYKYDANGCAVGYECENCNNLFNEANEKHELIRFIITSILGVIAVLIGLYAKSKDDVVEWVYNGFLVGGILSVLFGTIPYFGDMGRFVRPVVIISEMALVIWVALKTMKK